MDEGTEKQVKSYVITIKDLPQSVECAQRCVDSAAKFGVNVEMFNAVTPKHDPYAIAKKLQLNLEHFKDDVGSRPDNVLSAFLSHYRLWNLCAQGKSNFLIFEHDAVVIDNIPQYVNFKGCMSIGAPSYGKYEQAFQLGVIPLTSKPYFPGAHAYMLKPEAAKILIEKATYYAGPTDVFLQLSIFPWLEEFYPWPVVAKDTFTTIQNESGCLAKHSYVKNRGGYEFLKV